MIQAAYDYEELPRCPHKFTGKERDPETGLDYFGARYYSNGLGRFLSPDWAATPEDVPYADFGDPQTLNLYGYVRNNPLSHADADGHCCDFWDVANFVAGAANAWASDNLLGQGRQEQNTTAGKIGAAVGDAVAAVQGTIETVSGAGAAGGGLVLDATGVGALVGVPANAAGAAVAAHGVATAASGIIHLAKDAPNPFGSKGAPDHQQTAREEAKRIGGRQEVTVQISGGEKGSRRIDAARVVNGKVKEAVQVIRPNKNGTPPAREARAARDIQNATGVKPNMVPVRPLREQ